MNHVDCPRCLGTSEEPWPGPAYPCRLCDGQGTVLEYVADLYRLGWFTVGACQACGESRIVVGSQADGWRCAYCWIDEMSVPF